MKRLDEIVDFYLKMDTSYALMVTGDWGVGKTHYYKHTLKNKISNTPVFKDQTKNYRTISVSLFGLKSVEEVQSEIFLRLYPFLKNAKFKLGATIGKAVIKGLLHLKGFGDYNKYIEDIDVNPETLIKFEELVIVFDDLERISPNLNLEEFIGFINTLVENENVKIIIIANEDKIKTPNYSILKEKIVGNTIEFIPDINKSYNSIVESKFAGSPSYRSFLTENKNFILDIFIQKSSNFRILIFALSYFENIFSQISNQFTEDVPLKAKEKEILLILLKFSLSICIEYKEGKISFKKREGIDANGTFNWGNFSINDAIKSSKRDNQEEPEKSFKEIFTEQFYKDGGYYYFKSIYDFITGGNILIYTDLLAELNNLYHVERNEILPQYEIFNSLSYPNCYSLSDKKNLSLIKSMLKYVDAGKYDIGNYMPIFHFATRFNNPLKFNLDKLSKRIITGMKKGEDNYKYISALDMYLTISIDSEHKDHLLEIRNASLVINDKIKEINNLKNAKRLENICHTNFTLFFDEVFNVKDIYSYTPFLNSFNSFKFYSLFLNSTNEKRREIIRFIKERYQYSDLIQSEFIFLNAIKNKFEAKCKQIKNNNISGVLFNNMKDKLQELTDLVENFNKI